MSDTCGDGSLGPTFCLRSAHTGKYVKVGKPTDKNAVTLRGNSPEEASVFTFVPASYTNEPAPFDDYWGAIKLAQDNRVMRLGRDASITMSAITDVDDVARAGAVANIEYLLPRDSYTIKVDDAQLGITMSRDLRVVSLRPTSKDSSRGSTGCAERSGRVHVGDLVTSVNEQDIRGIDFSDVMLMFTCRPLAAVGFQVLQDGVARPAFSSGTSTLNSSAREREPPPNAKSVMKTTGFKLLNLVKNAAAGRTANIAALSSGQVAEATVDI